MMAGDIALLGRVVVKHGEVGHPEERQRLGIDQLLLLAHLQANGAERFGHDLLASGDDQQQVPRFGLCRFRHLTAFGLAQILEERRLHFILQHLDVRQGAGPKDTGDRRQIVQLFSRISGTAGNTDRLHLASGLQRGLERREIRSGEQRA